MMSKVLLTSPEQATRMLFVADIANKRFCTEYPIVMNFVGAPGEGKTVLAKNYAALRGWTEGNGFWMPNIVMKPAPEQQGFPRVHSLDDGREVVRYIPLEELPPMNWSGDGVCIIDEWDRPLGPAEANIDGGFMLTGRLGSYEMPKQIQRAGCMNGCTDDGTIPLAIFARQRVCHAYIDEKHSGGWKTDYAEPQGLHKTVISFMETHWETVNKPVEFEDMAADYQKYKRCATFVSAILKATEHCEKTTNIRAWDIMPLLVQGYFGFANTALFLSHQMVSSEVPSVQEIMISPATARVPNDPALQLAAASMVANANGTSTAPKKVQYLVRLRRDIADFGLRQVINEFPDVQGEQAYIEWANRRME